MLRRVVVDVSADVADGDARGFGLLGDDLDEAAAALLGEFGQGEANEDAVALWG